MPSRLRISLIALITLVVVGLPIAPANADGVPGAVKLATPVLSARRLPDFVASNIADSGIIEAISAELEVAPQNSCIIVSHEGRTIVDVGGDRAMVPASTLKLLTATAATALLGGDTRLETVAAASREPNDGVIEGDLYLIGGGDPLLTTPGYRLTFEDSEQLGNDFAQMADLIRDAGVSEIRGDVIGDDSRYDDERWVRTWPERYQREGFVGPLSALTVNDGSTGFTEDPDAAAGTRRPGDPPLLAAETLVTLLGDRGITVGGTARVGRAPADVDRVAVLESPTIDEIVSELLLSSDNTTAELLVKEIGYRETGVGTTKAGLDAVKSLVAELGLPVEGLDLKDGSGLDPDNHVPCTLIDALLSLDDEHPQFHRLLPTAGETGTLRRRMLYSPAQGRVHAKTGSLNEVNALAGMVETQAGVHLDFVYIVNGPEPRGIGVIDDFAVALVVVPPGPRAEDLAPLTPDR